ncbi:hypothetical protein C5B42_00820 [Candidatus Cerribacteria bacterium 'Amazon FNV 2010 28 9']|uniref:Uncharacterized protein n=1 Tax=Candidatus Cerribacteria bacterium 'Amazon FNV 2010 28 9' TaxID=2081795 RepID=A0A317JQC2_9BACT|nr:MAG: hypothetical protein C5B42_00820 [Candidatus Cerribacteria bacterium 'Amazon FNV 2010 28 9']
MNKTAQSPNDFDVIATTEGVKLQGEDLAVHEIKKRSISGVFAYILRAILLNVISGITQLIITGALSPTQYGVYGLVITVTSFFTIISDIGLGASLVQKKEFPTTKELRTVFTVQQCLAWIVFALIGVTALTLSRFGRLDREGIYLALAFGIAFPIVSLKTIPSILLERELQFHKLIIPAIVEAFVLNGTLAYFALHGAGIRSFTYAVLAQSIIGVVTMFFIRRWDMGLQFSKKEFFALMSIGTRFQLNDMLAKAKDDLFYLTVALFIPSSQFGYITWAKLWSRQPYSFTVDNVSAITFPAFSRLQHDYTSLGRAIEKTIFFITFIAFPMFAGLVVMFIPFLHLFPKQLKWEPAIVSLGLYSFALAFASFSTPLVNTLNAIGKISESLKMMVFWTTAQWVLFPLFFWKFGYTAVPLIDASLAFTSLYVVVLVKKYVKFNFFDQVWRQTLASLTMMIALYEFIPLWQRSLPLFILGIVAGGAMYSVLMITTGFEKIKGEVVSLLAKR